MAGEGTHFSHVGKLANVHVVLGIAMSRDELSVILVPMQGRHL